MIKYFVLLAIVFLTGMLLVTIFGLIQGNAQGLLKNFKQGFLLPKKRTKYTIILIGYTLASLIVLGLIYHHDLKKNFRDEDIRISISTNKGADLIK